MTDRTDYLHAGFCLRKSKWRFFLPVLFLLFLPASAGAISLEECINAAIRMNPGLEAASYRVRAARAAHSQARAPFYPHLTASGSHMRTDNPSQAFMMELNQKQLDMQDPDFDPADPGSTYNTRVSLGVEYLLFDGGQRRLREMTAQRQVEVSRHFLAARRNALVFEVIRGYYNALKAKEFTAVFRETMDSIEKSLELAQKRLDEGTALKTDVLNLEVQLALAEEDLVEAENRFHLAVAALNTSIGAEIVSPGQLEPTPERRIHTAKAEPQETVDQRPELKAAGLIVQARRLDRKRAKRNYLPGIRAFGSMDMDTRALDGFEESYVLGVAAQWNIFDGHARSGAVSEAGARRREAVALLKETRKELELDLKQACLGASNTFRRLAATRKAVASAEESLRMTRMLYEKGAVEITALMSAQAAATASAARNNAAYYDYLEAQADIDRAAGKLGTE